jgi:signal transduction histidine kinase/CheY-like chemotaxis protein
LTVAGAATLLILLTWIAMRGMSAEVGTSQDALLAIDRLEKAESALHRDVLSARSGLLRNYDPLVREINEMRGAVTRLRETAGYDPEIAAAIDEVMKSVDKTEGLTEQFKSRNALLQNSLAYFIVFGERLIKEEQDRNRAAQVSGLAAAILHLTLDSSAPIVADVDERLRTMPLGGPPAGSSPGWDSPASKPLIEHARMLRNLLPETDGILKEMFSSAGGRPQDRVRDLVVARADASESAAEVFRNILYGMSVVLVCLLVYLGVQLQSRARALRLRADFEHVIAGISTRFITSRPDEVRYHIERALEELAAILSADRAYFVIEGDPVQVYQWSDTPDTLPAGWPAGALEVVRQSMPEEGGIIHIPRVDHLSRGGNMDVLAAVGLRSWLCIPSFSDECPGAVLGFDALRRGPLSRGDGYGMFRSAFDAIAGALDRETLSREKQRLEAKLQQARRMETVGALASGVAHNFNNIAGAILGYTEIAQAHVRPESRTAASLDEIRRAGERARDLVDQILTFGRAGADKRERVRIQALIGETVSMFHASLPGEVEVKVREAPQETVVLADPARLQQVFLNLCNNAAQAMEGTGTIEIDLDVRASKTAFRHGPDELGPGQYLSVSISDLGRGMDEATQERIFEPFFTTRLEGNGLGLATARQIVRELGGAIAVRSIAGEGTRFEILLPCAALARDQAGHIPNRPPVTTTRHGNGETVLILDCERERLLRNEEILAALGYEPVGFTEPGDAADACRSARMRFDAALVCHPLGVAIEGAAILHEAAPGLPIILATGSARSMDAPALAAAGVTDVVHCPLVTTELAGALAQCLGSRVSS